MSVTVKNKGKGAANRVRVYLPGTTHAARLGTLEPSGPASSFEWSLEDQKIYRDPLKFPIVSVEYADDDGVKYRQNGALAAKQHRDGTFEYSGNSLEAPSEIIDFAIAYDEFGN